jgi:hypothetical protein
MKIINSERYYRNPLFSEILHVLRDTKRSKGTKRKKNRGRMYATEIMRTAVSTVFPVYCWSGYYRQKILYSTLKTSCASSLEKKKGVVSVRIFAGQ